MNMIAVYFTDNNGNIMYAKDIAPITGQVITKTAMPERHFNIERANLALEWLRDNVADSDPQGRIDFEIWRDEALKVLGKGQAS